MYLDKQDHLVVIGGGVTGLGIAADAVNRGLRVTVVERNTIGSGTTGNFHGILHSGARYAVNEPDVARECYQENQRLRQLMPGAITDTGGMFVAMNDDEAVYADTIMNACRSIGIPTTEITSEEALNREPAVSNELKRAFLVPDAVIDGPKVLEFCQKSALESGDSVEYIEHHTVTKLAVDGKKITSVQVKNSKTGETREISCGYVINATGVWAGHVAALAGVDFSMVFDKGSMIVCEQKFASMVLNRCRPENDSDLLVPHGNTSIMGTTARVIDDPDEAWPTQEEIDSLLDEGSIMVPALKGAPVERIYAGVRPLLQQGGIAATNAQSTRSMSRSFQVLDHSIDDVDNFISVVGGKVTVFRLMAERAVNVLEQKLSS